MSKYKEKMEQIHLIVHKVSDITRQRKPIISNFRTS